MQYPKDVLKNIARRKKKGYFALPPLASPEKSRPAWNAIFIGYNIKIEMWKKFLTPQDVSDIAAHNGLNVHPKNVSLAMGGRKLTKQEYAVIARSLRIPEAILYKNIAKKDRPTFYVEDLLHKDFLWQKFLGPMSAEDKVWAKENFTTIARYCKSRHLPTAVTIITRRHEALSKRTGIPIAKKSLYR